MTDRLVCTVGSEVTSLGATYPVLRGYVITKSRVGKPFNNVSLRLDDGDHNLVPIGVASEIWVGERRHDKELGDESIFRPLQEV